MSALVQDIETEQSDTRTDKVFQLVERMPTARLDLCFGHIWRRRPMHQLSQSDLTDSAQFQCARSPYQSI
jgi:hypothetical protein